MSERTLILIGLACLSLAGCNGVTAEQRTLLSSGVESYEAQQYRTAIDQLSELLASAEDPGLTAEARYIRGMSLIKVGERARARRDLAEAGAAADVNRPTAWRARVVLGSLHFDDGDWDAAGRAYSEALQLMPSTPEKATVLFRIGVCYERTGRWEAAEGVYATLLNDFPESPLAPTAQRRLRRNARYFSIQAGAFSHPENAENFALQLERQGLPVRISHEPRTNSTLHIVLVGQYETYEEAFRYLGLVREYVPDAQLWP